MSFQKKESSRVETFLEGKLLSFAFVKIHEFVKVASLVNKANFGKILNALFKNLKHLDKV